MKTHRFVWLVPEGGAAPGASLVGGALVFEERGQRATISCVDTDKLAVLRVFRRMFDEPQSPAPPPFERSAVLCVLGEELVKLSREGGDHE